MINQVAEAVHQENGDSYICRMKAKHNPVKTSIADAAAFIDIHNGKNGYIRKIKNRRKKRNINSSIQKKLINESLDIKEVEQGVEVNGTLSEQEIVEMGYKPFCETEQTDENAVVKYTEYETCIVQEWTVENEEEYEE